jgi:hypothetical protein
MWNNIDSRALGCQQETKGIDPIVMGAELDIIFIHSKEGQWLAP